MGRLPEDGQTDVDEKVRTAAGDEEDADGGNWSGEWLAGGGKSGVLDWQSDMETVRKGMHGRKASKEVFGESGARNLPRMVMRMRRTAEMGSVPAMLGDAVPFLGL